MSGNITNNNREILNARSSITSQPEYLRSTNHILDVNSITGTGSLAPEVKITDGTNIVNVLKSDGTAVGQNAELVTGTYLSVPFSTTTVQAVGTTDAGNYSSVSVEMSSQGTSSSVTFQVSDDNVNWRSLTMYTSNSFTGSFSTTSTSSSWSAPLSQRYFRLNVTGISAGTTAGIIIFKALPFAPPVTSAIQTGTWTVGSNSATGSAVPANAFYMGLNNAGGLAGWSAAGNAGDGTTGTSIASVGGWMFNGVNWDRNRGNNTGTVVAAGTTSTQTDIALTTYNASKLIVLVSITAGAGSVTVTVDGLSTGGASYRYNILTSTALSGVGVTPLRIFPGATPVANLAVNDVVPRSVRVTATVSGSITYGIDSVLSV